MTDNSSSSTNTNDIFSATNQLEWNQKKQDIMLNLGLASSNESDQTPTPTRFIRNCEEVGLFQDLQNVNPFDEVFKNAVENPTKVTLQPPIITSDDTLHTPQIYPHLDHSISNSNDYSNRDDGDNPLVIVLNPEKDKITLTKEKVKAALIKKSTGGIIPVPINKLKEPEPQNTAVTNKINDAKSWQKEANRVAQARCRKRKQREFEDMKIENKLLKEQNMKLSNMNLILQQTITKLQEELKAQIEPEAKESSSDMTDRISAVCLNQKNNINSIPKNTPVAIVLKNVAKSPKNNEIPIIASPMASNNVFFQVSTQNNNDSAIKVPLNKIQNNSEAVIMVLPQTPSQSNIFFLKAKQTEK